MNTVKKADKELAIAKPTWPNSRLKANCQARIAFKNSENRATYMGFLGSCLAKKLGVSIFININATKPNASAIKL